MQIRNQKIPKPPEIFGERKQIRYFQRGNASEGDNLLYEVVSLIQKEGDCSPAPTKLLECFGYMRNGYICVPIYMLQHHKYIMRVEEVVGECIGEEVAKILIDFAVSGERTAVRYGVNSLEIANEIYHIVVGFIRTSSVV